MSYCWFNRQEILEKAKERYSKERAAEYCLKSKEAIKERVEVLCKKSNNFYRIFFIFYTIFNHLL